MDEQIRIPCIIQRAGTSKGIYIKESDLPTDPELRKKYILAIFGSPDVRQIDGLGGAEPLTSKLAIIGPASRPDADVDYTFAQVSITDAVVDFGGNCGNISSGVGPVAIDEGLVKVKSPVTHVRIHNTNTGKILNAEVQTEGGKAKVSGECEIAGVPGSAAPIELDFSGTAGAATGRLLPTGNPVDVIDTTIGPVEISIVDVANPCCFVYAPSVHLTGTETPQEVDGNPEALRILEEIRARCCVMIGMADSVEDASKNHPAIPMIIFVNKAQDYVNFTDGSTIHAEDVDFVARNMFMQILHKTYAGTATACTAAAAKIPGTIVNRVIPDIEKISTIRIGHPAGILPVVGAVEDGVVKKASLIRTSRRIMDGSVYIERKKVMPK